MNCDVLGATSEVSDQKFLGFLKHRLRGVWSEERDVRPEVCSVMNEMSVFVC